MTTEHVVAQGEHLPGIAERYKLKSWKTLWDDPDNEELKNKRKDPAALLPGDVVVIPDKGKKVEKCATNKSHKFKVNLEKIKLRIKALDPLGEPIKDTPGELVVDGQTFEVTSDGDGVVEQDVRSDARFAALRIDDMEFELQIGSLDPFAELTGVEARLGNMGYYTGQVGDGDEDAMKFAVELFQFDQDMSISGEHADIGDKLSEVYGV